MIRKGIIAVSVAAAAATLILAMVSQRRAIHWDASHAPELSLDPAPIPVFAERLLDADQRWAHAVIADSCATTSYSSRHQPPTAVLTPGKATVDFRNRYQLGRQRLWWDWGRRPRQRPAWTGGDVRFDDEYEDHVQDLRRSASLRLNMLLGDAAFLLRYTDTPHHQAIIRFPLWVPLILAAAYPTLAFIRGPLRRWRRRRKGLCLKCGYNLTGNVTGVCPECGAAV